MTSDGSSFADLFAFLFSRLLPNFNQVSLRHDPMVALIVLKHTKKFCDCDLTQAADFRSSEEKKGLFFKKANITNEQHFVFVHT